MAKLPTIELSADNTQLEAYRKPILAALNETGGRDYILNIAASLGQSMKNAFNTTDYELDSGKIRWVKALQVQGAIMNEEGLLTAPIPFVWELTDTGRAQL